MKQSEAKALMAVLSAAFPRQPLEPETVSLYVEGLEQFDLPFSEARLTLVSLIQSSPFFPSIADLVSVMGRRTWEFREEHRQDVPAFPSPPCKHGNVDDCETCRAEFKAMRNRLVEDMSPDRLRMQLGMTRDPQRREDLARALARKITAGLDKQPESPPFTKQPRHASVCSGVGKPWVIQGGKAVCSCGNPKHVREDRPYVPAVKR